MLNDWEVDVLQYENLPPGEYLLHIRGGLIEEYYASSELAIKVTVLQAWYKTGWAILVYILLLAGAAFLFYKFQVNHKLEHAEAYRDIVKREIWTVGDMVWAPSDKRAQYAVENFMKIPAGGWDNWVEMESKFVKPVHAKSWAKRVSRGKTPDRDGAVDDAIFKQT